MFPRSEQHRLRADRGADLAEHIGAVDVGQAGGQDHEIRWCGREQSECLGSGARGQDGQASALQLPARISRCNLHTVSIPIPRGLQTPDAL